MLQPAEVRPLPGYRIWIRYNDGQCGEVDLSHLVGKGAFKAWEEPGCYGSVHIDTWGAIAWSNGIELCPDALYMDFTGKPWDELPTDAADPNLHAELCRFYGIIIRMYFGDHGHLTSMRFMVASKDLLASAT